MDTTALRNLTNIYHACEKQGIIMILSHVNEQPMKVMAKAGFDRMVGPENFCANIDVALERAAKLVAAE